MLRFDVEPVRLSLKTASAISVVLNELASNAAKRGDGDIEIALGRHLAKEQYAVVMCDMEAQVPPVMERWVVAPDTIQPGDDAADITGLVPIPGGNLVFLGIEIFLAPGNRRRLAQLEAAIHAP